MKLLVINPNTGQATTERLQLIIAPSVPKGVTFRCITAKFGFPYITSKEGDVVATHAVLETRKSYKDQCPESDLGRCRFSGCAANVAIKM